MTPKAKMQISRQERYNRQTLFPGIGAAGQEKLSQARVAVIGCGALGTAQAESLARAGVGELRIVDRDFVELSNLHRQTLFTEDDALNHQPKAAAAAQHLAKINSAINIRPEVADVNLSNVERLIEGCDLVIDGTDNFSTRYLLNDACVKHSINWVYGAAVSSYGATMTIRPRVSPCLRCIFPEEPNAASAPTCDTAGVIQPIIATIAAAQITEALKLLTGNTDALHASLLQFDLWANDWRRIRLKQTAPDCPACALNTYPALDAERADVAAVLCGRNAVQIASPQGRRIDLAQLAEKLRPVGAVKANEYLVRLSVDGCEITVFQDARAIIRGTDDVTTARSLYAKYVGS
jgi:adenylyltransferase/sulfurtransferase